MLVDGPSLLFVIEEIELDSFMADGKAKVCFDDVGYLLWAVVVPDQVQNYSPLLFSEMCTASVPFPACSRILMGYRGSVAVIGTPVSG